MSVQNALEACQADVVYANTLVTFWAVLAAKRMGLPSLWNVREVDPATSYFDHLPKSVRSDAYRCFCHPYRVIFVSGASLNLSSRFASQANCDIIYAVPWTVSGSKGDAQSSIVPRRVRNLG